MSESRSQPVNLPGARPLMNLLDGAVEVHLLGYYTVVFVLCDSMREDVNVNGFFF